MATVNISIYSGGGDFDVTLEYPESNGQAWGADKSHLDRMVNEAAARIKRAYTPETSEDTK